MKSESTVGIVIRRTDFSEADRIILFLTPLGFRTAIAKGVRRQKSKLAGGVELLSESEITLRKGRGEILTLTQARMSVFYKNILSNYDRLQFAYEVMKIISKSAQDNDDGSWFKVLSGVLKSLNNESINFGLIKTWFYVRYSDLMGEEINLYSDIDGKKLLESEKYSYDYSENAFYKNEKGNINSSHIKFLRLISKKTISSLSQVGGTDMILAEVLYIARRHAGY